MACSRGNVITSYSIHYTKLYDHSQIQELVTDYGKVDILWLDGGWVRKKTEEEVKDQLLDIYEGSRWARNPQSQDIDMPRLVSYNFV